MSGSDRIDDLMPVPASVRRGAGTLRVGAVLGYRIDGVAQACLEAAVVRALDAAVRGAHGRLQSVADRAVAILRIECTASGGEVPAPGDDESYRLAVDPELGIDLVAPQPAGVRHGLTTLQQLLGTGPHGPEVPAVVIEDRPRFGWRGLLIDVSRHFVPVPVLLRNLEAMAAVKLNVFHWHLTDDHGFRVESFEFPELHRRGSEGQYYTQDEIRAVVRFAAARGIRVVPEFDVPGHASSWLVGYPDLAAVEREYRLPRAWGRHDACLDPESDAVDAFLGRLFGEFTALFPDPFVHIGGDEVGGLDRDVQARFNRRIHQLLGGLGKRLMGWDEITHRDLPADTVVQSWRGPDSIQAIAAAGFACVRSHGYYLDHLQPAAAHYAVDPVDDLGTNAAVAADRVLGGEACMWTEYADADNLDARIWPRAAAIAERLWSPAEVDDVEEMYRRLEVLSHALHDLGLRHVRVYRDRLAHCAGGREVAALALLVGLLAPLPHTAGQSPRVTDRTTRLDALVDVVAPDRAAVRRFAATVHRLTAGDASAAPELEHTLQLWADNHERLQRALQGTVVFEQLEPLSRALTDLAQTGLLVLRPPGPARPAGWLDAAGASLRRGAEVHADLVLQVVAPIRLLVEAAAGGAQPH